MKRAGWVLAAGALLCWAGCDAIEEAATMSEPPPKQKLPTLERPPEETIVSTPRPDAPVPEPAAPRDFWREALIEPRQGELPEPQPEQGWGASLQEGLSTAAESGRPLLVWLRCSESPRSAALDFLESPGSSLADVLARYERVELRDALELDLKYLPLDRFQDPDQACWCWALSPQGQVYSVFGPGGPATTTATDTERFERWARDVLAYHADPRRADWGFDDAPPSATDRSRVMANHPALGLWRNRAQKRAGYEDRGCLCCHQARDVLWVDDDAEHSLPRHLHWWIWPDEGTAGITFDVAEPLQIADIEPGSPAFRAELRVGDRLGAMDGRLLFGAADVRAALERGPEQDGEVTLVWVRGVDVMEGELPLGTTWRRTDLTWRASLRESVLRAHPGFIPRDPPLALRRKLNLPEGQRMAIFPELIPGSPAAKAGLQKNHLILSVRNLREDLRGEAFLMMMGMVAKPGEVVPLEVMTPDGEIRTFRLEMMSAVEAAPDGR